MALRQESKRQKLLFSDAQSSHYPSLYVGFLNIIHPERLHIIGAPEVAFLQGLSVPDRLGIVQQFRKTIVSVS